MLQLINFCINNLKKPLDIAESDRRMYDLYHLLHDDSNCLHKWRRFGDRITGWAKKVIHLVQCNICTSGITFVAHPVDIISFLQLENNL